MTIPLGLYRHYKGADYHLVGIAKHGETAEPMAVYRAAGSDELWVRPLAVFADGVLIDGEPAPRFRWTGAAEEA